MSDELRNCPHCGEALDRFKAHCCRGGLRNCPLCASPAAQLSRVGDHWRVACDVCGSSTGHHGTGGAARFSWQARPEEDRLRAEVERLRGPLCDFFDRSTPSLAHGGAWKVPPSVIERMRAALAREEGR